MKIPKRIPKKRRRFYAVDHFQYDGLMRRFRKQVRAAKKSKLPQKESFKRIGRLVRLTEHLKNVGAL